MDVYFIIFVIICFVGVKIYGPGEFNKDYLSPKSTLPVKGIFVMLVFFTHFISYHKLTGEFDSFANWYHANIKQTIVTMFLFYSGYGVMEAIKNKGKDYVRKLPLKALKLWIHFVIVVCMFLALKLATGHSYSAEKIIKAFLTTQSIGNSNWYIGAMLCMYLLTFVAFIFFTFSKKEHRYLPAIILTLLCVGYIFLCVHVRMSKFWVNTIICYPIGIWYSIFKEKIERIMFKNDIVYWLALLCAVTPFCIFYTMKSTMRWYMLSMVFFLFAGIIITMKVNFGNGFLNFLGKHVFSIYILQRLPFIILDEVGFLEKHPVHSFVISFVATAFMAHVFDILTEKLDDKIFGKKVAKLPEVKASEK
ncbi:MAG: acyltransferase [Lachnospiraceae bacterium]|nr:acyltransferase [Lachnospiraceae bacterium]